VVIPTYNRAAMIKRAITSVLTQDHEDLEVIVVDDLSRDNTEEVVRGIKDPRVKYIRRPENKGAGAARNTGIRESRGGYIAFLDSDDEFLPGKLRAQVRMFEDLSLKPGLVFANIWENEAKKKSSVPGKTPSGYVEIGKKFPASVYCGPPTWMLTRECIGKVGFFDEILWTLEDLDYFARAVRDCPVYFINQPLVLKHTHACKKGSVPDRYAQRTGERILEKWYGEMKKDKRFLVNFYCMMGKDMMRSKKKEKAVEYLRKAFEADPFNAKVLWKLGRAVMSGRGGNR